MIKLKVFQTYYQSTQYDEYGLKNLPPFVEIVNTTEYNYEHSELNPFWSEYMFIKHVYEHLGEYDCEYIGFDQYKRHFDYDKVLEIIKDKDDVCFINCVEKVNVYDHYALSHKEKD